MSLQPESKVLTKSEIETVPEDAGMRPVSVPPSKLEYEILYKSLGKIEDVLFNALSPDDVPNEVLDSLLTLDTKPWTSSMGYRAKILVQLLENALAGVSEDKISGADRSITDRLLLEVNVFSEFMNRAEKGKHDGNDIHGASYSLLLAAIESIAETLQKHEESIGMLFYREPEVTVKVSLPDLSEPLLQSIPKSEELVIPDRIVIQPDLEAVDNSTTKNENEKSSDKPGFFTRFVRRLKNIFRKSETDESVYIRLKHNDGTAPDYSKRKSTGTRETESRVDKGTEEQEKKLRYLANTSEEGVIGLNQARRAPFESSETDREGELNNTEAERKRREEGLDGSIETLDQDFFSHLAVTAPAVTVSAAGKMLRLDVWLNAIKENNPDNKALPLYEDCYKSKECLSLSKLHGRKISETDCKRSAFAGEVTLPLSPHYMVVGISFFDQDGIEIENGKNNRVDECIFGSAKTVAPPGCYQIAYRVRKRETEAISPELIRKFRYALPDFSPVMGQAEQKFCERLKKLDCSSRDRAQLWLEYAKTYNFPYCYTQSDPVMYLVNAAGSHAESMIAGIKLNDCQGFSFHSSIRLRALDIPAITIGGALPDKENKGFQVKTGHAQTLVFDESGFNILDLTRHVAGTLKPEVLPVDWNQIVADLKNADAETVYKIGREAGTLIRALSGSDNLEVDTRNHRYALRGLRRFTKTLLKGSPHGDTLPQASVLTDEFAVKKSPFLALIKAEDYLTALKERISSGLSKGSLKAVYEYVENNPPPDVKLTYDDRVSLGDVNTTFIHQIRKTVKTCLVEATKDLLESSGVNNASKKEAMKWIATECIPSNYKQFEKEILQKPQHYIRDGAKLNVSQRSYFFRPEYLGLLDKEERQAMMITLLYDLNSTVRESTLRLRDPGQNASIAIRSAVEAILKGSEFEREKGELSVERQSYILKGIAQFIYDLKKYPLCAGEEKERELSERNRLCAPLLNAFESITDAGPDSARVVVIDILCASTDIDRKPLEEIVLSLAKKPDSVLLGSQTLSRAEDVRLWNSAIAKRLAFDLNFGNNDGFILQIFSDAGLKIDLRPHGALLETALSRSRETLLRRWQDQMINFPCHDNPASYITSRLSDSEPVRYYHFLETLKTTGGISVEVIKRAWPTIPEEEVAHRLALKVSIVDGRLRYRDSAGLNYSPEVDVAAVDLRTIAEAGFLSGTLTRTFLGSYYGKHPQSHNLDPYFSKLKEKFPDQWVLTRSSLFGKDPFQETRIIATLVSRYTESVEVKDFYRASLALAVNRIRRPLQLSVLNECTPGDIERAYQEGVKEGLKKIVKELGGEEARKILSENRVPLQHFSRADERLERIYDVLFKEFKLRIVRKNDEVADMAVVDTAQLLLTEDITDENICHEILLPLFETGEKFDREESAISDNARTLAVLTAALSTEHSRLPDSIAENLGVASDYLPLLYRRVEAEKASFAHIWEHLRYSVETDRSYESLPEIIEDVREEVSRLTARRPSLRPLTFSSYLQHKAGRTTPLQYDGEFAEFRQYTHGMDRKMIDQRVLGRTGKDYVRLYRDRENYKVIALIDLEWLTGDTPEEQQSRIKELYRNVFLAERDGFKPEVILEFRGYPINPFAEKIKSDCTTATSSGFLLVLENLLLEVSAIKDAEHEIYGGGQFRGLVPLHPAHMDSLRKAVVLLGIDAEQISDAEWFCSAVRKARGDVIRL